MTWGSIVIGLAVLAPFVGCAVMAWSPQRRELARRTKRRMVSGRRERKLLGLIP